MNYKFLSATLALSMMVTTFAVPVFAETAEEPVASDTAETQTNDETPTSTTEQLSAEQTPAESEQTGAKTGQPSETTPSECEQTGNEQGNESAEGKSSKTTPVEGQTIEGEGTEQKSTEGETPAEGDNPVEGEIPAEEQTAAPEDDSQADEAQTSDETADAQTDEDPVIMEINGNKVTINTMLKGEEDGITLNTGVKVDGEKDTRKILVYNPEKDEYDVQIGGELDITGVWDQYDFFKLMYTLKNGNKKFRSKSLVGDWEYTFYVNPDVVTVDEDILKDTALWQKAFEDDSTDASGFFDYMKCNNVGYDPATGKVTVDFTISENGKGEVSIATIEDVAGTKPDKIHAYSPAGAFTIKRENFHKGQPVFPFRNKDANEGSQFMGYVNMKPWMALVVPIGFQSKIMHTDLTLDIPDAEVVFKVENGTWEDGSADSKSVKVPVDMVKLADGTYKPAGMLLPTDVPAGMKAAKGYDQNSGRWVPVLNYDENGVVLNSDGTPSVTYVFQFDKIKETTPETPEKPETPATPAPETSATPAPETKTESATAPSKNTTVQTDVFTGIGALLGLQGLSAAGIWTVLKRRKK